LARLQELFAELRLEPKEAKTRMVHLQVGGAGFDFLGTTTDWFGDQPPEHLSGDHIRPLARGQGHEARS
jgi:hypothetical protein